MALTGKVISVSRSAGHVFSKKPKPRLNLIAGEGVEGDAHRGKTVKHRSRVAADPTQPNLRQVHLIHSELFGELAAHGFKIEAGDMGENILTRGIDLLSLPRDTILQIGDGVALRVTGLRNPCQQLNDFRTGLLAAVLDHAEDGSLIRKAGIMAVVESGGEVAIGDTITVQMPAEPHHSLERV